MGNALNVKEVLMVLRMPRATFTLLDSTSHAVLNAVLYLDMTVWRAGEGV